MTVKLFTIGFTQKTAEDFFARLRKAGVKKIIDTRLWPDTQLSGFARKKDLGYFLKNLTNIDYAHDVVLAPSEDILSDYKNKKITWPQYETRYTELLHQRKISEKLAANDLDGVCFLCAEHKPHHCHRRLLAEYLQNEWRDRTIQIAHL